MIVVSIMWENKAYFMRNRPMCLVVGKMVFHSYVCCNVNRVLLPMRTENASNANRGTGVTPSTPPKKIILDANISFPTEIQLNVVSDGFSLHQAVKEIIQYRTVAYPGIFFGGGFNKFS